MKMVSIRWFPPSWVQLKAANRVIYIDPAYLAKYFTRYPGKIEFSRWPDPIDGLPGELETADLILVTHSHKDHAKRVTVDRLKSTGTLVVAPRSCNKELGEEITTVSPGDELDLGYATVRVVHAYNVETVKSKKVWHKRGNCVGYLVAIEGVTVYHSGDTDLIPEVTELGPVDVALLPIGGTYTMDIVDAARAALAIKPVVAIPMHCMSANPAEFKEIVEARSSIVVAPLQVGGIYLYRKTNAVMVPGTES